MQISMDTRSNCARVVQSRLGPSIVHATPSAHIGGHSSGAPGIRTASSLPERHFLFRVRLWLLPAAVLVLAAVINHHVAQPSWLA